MKKTTNWITIPEDTIHTPVSAKKEIKKSSEKPVKNKIFWGASFALLVVASFALLAPSQFSQLLKGSLFDTSGVTQDQMQVDLTPKPVDTAKIDNIMKANTVDPTITAVKTDGTPNTNTPDSKTDAVSATPVVPAPENVVKPEDEAVDISVTPVDKTKTPVTPENQTGGQPSVVTEDCKTDMDCFAKHLKDCSLAKAAADAKGVKIDLSVTGAKDSDCEFTASASIKDQKTDMQCKIAKGDYKADDVNKIFTSKDELAKNCTGTDTFAAYLDSQVAVNTAPSADDEQAKLIADLKKQIDELQQQRIDDTKTMQDLTAAVQDQATHSAAPSAVPTSITSTTTIGQSQTLSPAFRTNPYKVTITPQQMLQQNGAQGGSYVQQSSGYSQSDYQEYQQIQNEQYQPSVSRAVANSGQTPQSGPSEVLLIAFALTFLAMVGWRFVRVLI